MKKILVTLQCCFIFSLSFSQSLQNTQWEFYNTGIMDTVSAIFETDTFRMIDSNEDEVVISWYEEFSDTMRISDIRGYGNICATSDTGVYTFIISNDSLYFSLISDPCTQRGNAAPSVVYWRKNVPTGISKFKDNVNFHIYPNPNDGQFTVESSQIGTFEIKTISGQLVQQGNINIGRNQMNLNLETGLYVIRLNQNGELITRKTLVN